jgi:hypothetical protein
VVARGERTCGITPLARLSMSVRCREIQSAAPLEHRKISAASIFARPFELTPQIPTARFRGSFPDLPGGVAQLGERVNGIHEVRGSIPLASTVGPAKGG